MDHIDKVTSQLSSYYTKDEQFPDCLYLYGQKSVGKSLCLQKFLQSQDWITTAVVHTIECYANKTLFETIINAFYGHQPSKENDYLPFAKTDSIEDFILELSLMDKPGNSYLIVIEEAEKLRDMEFNLLSVFTKLQELTGINISCIFLSHIAFEKMGTTEMIKIYVPDYCKNDLIKIFTSKYKDIHMGIFKNISSNPELNEETKIRQLQVAETLDETFYKCYLNNFLNVFYKACRDITELHSLAKKCYKAYYAPVLTEEIKYNDITNLWRHSQKALKISLQTGHMRVENLASTDLSQKMNPELTMEPTKENSIRGFAQTLELPNYAKFLLIASFLASHNDAKYDRRLFMKHHGKEKKRQHPKSKVSEKMNVQFGPKSFTIDRLLAIFYAILEEKVGLTCNLLSQISTLVDLNFLTFVSGESNIMDGTARLQSTIGLDFAINIGRVVGFNVKQYLTDFL